MGNYNKLICDPTIRQKALLEEAGPETTTVKMVNKIGIMGVSQPEILAEGLCPNCRTVIDLWATGQGLELSLHGKGYLTEPLAKMNRKGGRAFNSTIGNHPAPKPKTIDPPASWINLFIKKITRRGN